MSIAPYDGVWHRIGCRSLRRRCGQYGHDRVKVIGFAIGVDDYEVVVVWVEVEVEVGVEVDVAFLLVVVAAPSLLRGETHVKPVRGSRARRHDESFHQWRRGQEG